MEETKSSGSKKRSHGKNFSKPVTENARKIPAKDIPSEFAQQSQIGYHPDPNIHFQQLMGSTPTRYNEGHISCVSYDVAAAQRASRPNGDKPDLPKM